MASPSSRSLCADAARRCPQARLAAATLGRAALVGAVGAVLEGVPWPVAVLGPALPQAVGVASLPRGPHHPDPAGVRGVVVLGLRRRAFHGCPACLASLGQAWSQAAGLLRSNGLSLSLLRDGLPIASPLVDALGPQRSPVLPSRGPIALTTLSRRNCSEQARGCCFPQSRASSRSGCLSGTSGPARSRPSSVCSGCSSSRFRKRRLDGSFFAPAAEKSLG